MSWYIHPSKQLRDDELPPELVVTNRDGSIEQAYVPETRLYSLEERATCNAHAIKRLKDENAKLRELVRDLWDFTIIGTNTPHLFSAEWHAQACAIRDRARELGVEVAQ